MAEAEILNGDSTPAADNLKDLRPILQAILRTNENLATQNKALYQLLASGHINTSSARWDLPAQGGNENTVDNYHAPCSRLSRRSLIDHLNVQETNTQIWEGILSISAIESHEFMQAFYYLSRFLKRATMSHRCSCQVWMDDLYGLKKMSRSISYSEAKRNINVLWSEIKDRDALPPIQTVSKAEDPSSFSVRLFRIVDLSPLVLASILASTPE